MTSSPVRIGTRGSALALAQATTVRDGLVAHGVAAELEIITTQGDRRPPDTAWGEGAFVTAIADALLAGRIDVAVHSAKDVPTDEDPRLVLAAFLERAPSGDVVVVPTGRSAAALADLAPNARVGTDSPRRTAFLRAVRPDLRLHPLHGNVDTRLRRLEAGESDALVLAEAGLTRLDRGDRIAFRLPPDVVPPAPGQGALAVQVRADDAETRGLVALLDDAATRRAVTLERELLAASGGGCRAPLGASATVAEDGGLEMIAGFARPDGSLATITRRRTTAGRSAGGAGSPEADQRLVDTELVEAVLGDLARAASGFAVAAEWPGVLVTRSADQAPALALALVDRGLAPVLVPAIEIEPLPSALAGAIRSWSSYEWVVVTSSNAAAVLAQALQARRDGATAASPGPRIAAVGRATTRTLLASGLPVAFRPAKATARTLAQTLPLEPGARILAPRSDVADDGLIEILQGRGATVEAVIAYRTHLAPAASRASLAAALDTRPRAAVFTSGSTVRGLLELAETIARRNDLLAIPAVCIGQPTAEEARRQGFEVVATSERQAVGAIADATAGYFRLQEVPT